MRVCVLTENTCLPGFACEHGLSLYVESGGRAYVVDCGQSDVFARNAQTLGIDWNQVTCGFLSHSHYDHGNGLAVLWQLLPGLPVYAQPACWQSSCWKHNPESEQEKYIGLDFAALDPYKDQMKSAADCRIPGVHCIPVHHDGCKARALQDGLYIRPLEAPYALEQPDAFGHEQALVFEEADGAVVICSCSHAGADQILAKVHEELPDVSVKAFIGGFHLKDAFGRMPEEQAQARIEGLARRLQQEAGTCFYTGHCTGERPYALMKDILQESLQPLSSGMELTL